MRKWFLIALMLGALFVFPIPASAQTDVTLSTVNVQLWSEYDQPSMLVIVDFEVSPDTQLPTKLTFRLPQGANLIAVASYAADGSLVNSKFDGPTKDGEWQSFTVTLDAKSAHFEYYQPLTFNGNQRTFSYLWDSAYAVDAFGMRVLEPLDTASLTTTPQLASISEENGLKYYSGAPVKLASGEQFSLNLEYKKTSDTLVSPSQGLQPSAPVNENTPGRVSLSNSLPYVIGGLGIVMIVGGFIYYWQAGRASTKKARRRSRSYAETEDDSEEIYCSQCGARAKSSDRFCRTCGARLKHQEE